MTSTLASRRRSFAFPRYSGILAALVLATLPARAASAQAAAPCAAPEARAFDFWVGTWEVTAADGTVAGTNRITREEDGCVLVERWQGTSGSSGVSLNYYDPAERVWKQVWVAPGYHIEIEGGLLDDGSMRLVGTIVEEGETAPFRGTWTPRPDGTIRQHFEVTTEGAWTTWFDGLYTRVADDGLQAEVDALNRTRALQRQAHVERDADLLVSTFAEPLYSIQNGSVAQPTAAESLVRFQPYFDRSTFVAWDDLEPPVVRMSQDGSQAYVIVQKRVALRLRGEENAPLTDTRFAWVETWEKVEAEWRMTAIASTREAASSDGNATLQGEALACDSPQARAFDFWLGDWDISQRIRTADGGFIELPARTSVSLAVDGCALVEHWEGEVQFFWEGMQSPEPLSALSVRSYDPTSGTWSIHWLDSRSPTFGNPSVGRFENGRGEFFRETDTPDGLRVLRITFSDITEDAVRWELAVSDATRAEWTVLWTMEMTRGSH